MSIQHPDTWTIRHNAANIAHNLPQYSEFEGGGFVLHKMRVGNSESKFSGWFTADGTLITASRIDRLNRDYNVNPGSAAWNDIQARGKRYLVSKES